MDKEQQIGCVICEESGTPAEFKVKGEDPTGFLIAECILQQSDETNRNRRRYPREELLKGINSPRIQELLRTGLMGECGHPTDQSLARQSKIDGTLVQVWHKKIWMDGDLVKAYVTGASNDYGKSFDMDLRRGQVPAFSLRAIGSLVNENGCMTVRHLQPITWDRVYYPSHSKAYMTKIVSNESVSVSPKVFYEIAEGEYYHSKQTEINQVSEAGNCPMGEELIIPLTQAEVSNYLMQESTNVQTAISTFDVLYESIQLNPSLNTVTMKTRMGDTFHICLEDAVKREVVDAIARYF